MKQLELLQHPVTYYHVLTTSTDTLRQYGVISINLSDHFMTFCTIKITMQTFSKDHFSKVRCITNHTKDLFIEKLQNADWSKVFYAENVDSAWAVFKDTFVRSTHSRTY